MSKQSYIWQKKDWPKFQWDYSRLIPLLAEARKIQGKLLVQASFVGIEIEAQFLEQDALESAAIEGEKLDVQSIKSSVARRLGLSVAGLPSEKRNIEGLVGMLVDATRGFSRPLDAKRLKGWQAGLFPTGYSGINEIEVGGWRKSKEPMRVISGSIGKPRIHFEAPPSKAISKEMTYFFKWFNSKTEIDGLIRAAIAHLWFITIHPFDDGNGRIARAITDLSLAQDEKLERRLYSLSSQISQDRASYYKVLEKTQKGTLDITDWIEWFLKTFIKAIQNSQVTIERALIIRNFWISHSQIEISARQKKVVQKMLEFEPDGFVGGITNRKYVSIAKVSPASAKRDLLDLEDKGIIKRGTAKGRSISYHLKMKK